jgi:hypothetical protein
MTEDNVQSDIVGYGFRLESAGVHYDRDEGSWTLCCEVRWRSRPGDPPLPAVVKELSRRPGVSLLVWSPLGRPIPGPE